MNRIIKGSRVQNKFDLRLKGIVTGFKKINHRMIPLVKYSNGDIILDGQCQLASKYKP
jgi:hypothetical protein